MRMLKFTTKAALPVASAVISGGASIIPTLISVFQENKEHLTDILTGDKAEDEIMFYIISDKFNSNARFDRLATARILFDLLKKEKI